MSFDYTREPVMKDTKFMTGKEKEKVLQHWETFLKNGCKRADFTKDLYHHLINQCSFMAHYDINGFYDTYFAEGEDTVHFLSQFDRSKGYRSVEIGMTYWIRDGNDVCQGYYDINNAMVDIAGKYIPALVAGAEGHQKKADLARAKALLAKHGLEMK
jgi:hypothetical protein